MMKNGQTELVFILDRSGSMSGLEKATIKGFNTMLKQQKKEEGEAFITTILFDDEYKLLHDRINICEISQITEKEYYVNGCTALLDAVGNAINKVSTYQKILSEDERSEKVLFVITTDGMENSSHEYTFNKVRNLIKLHKEKYGWEFLFLGANIDAIATAYSFGISSDRAASYNADEEGTSLNYKAVSSAVSNLRKNKILSQSWKADIDEDYKSRNK